MKLSIWGDPYPISYGTSAVHAVAETVEEARALALSETAKVVSFTQFEQKSGPQCETLGEPTFVLDIPCAIWDSWRE